jgi:pentatricopeptide repeat protein
MRLVLIRLFEACGRAPYWVKGYENIVRDAMVLMEGCELHPDIAVYNSILEAFAHAGDSVAAEYYFWEAKRKGIAPNVLTYSALLAAYAKSQSIGASNYGWQGRAVRAAPRRLTRDELAMKTIGAVRTHEIRK